MKNRIYSETVPIIPKTIRFNPKLDCYKVLCAAFAKIVMDFEKKMELLVSNVLTDFGLVGFAKIRATERQRPEVWRHQLRLLAQLFSI